jgi:nucleotide-binding universal stress UspA family protein
MFAHLLRTPKPAMRNLRLGPLHWPLDAVSPLAPFVHFLHIRSKAMEIKKIVVGVDFSKDSEIAAQEALIVARRTGAEVVLAHIGMVVDQNRGLVATGHQAEWEKLANIQLAKDRARLEDMRMRLSGQGPEVSHSFIDGIADTGLVETATSIGAEMIAIGTHGRTGFKRLLMGSVAERVVRLFDGAVLVARPGTKDVGGYRRILVPTDFSAWAEDALKMALVLAGNDASIDLLHAWQIPVIAAEVAVPLGDQKASVEAAGAKLIAEHKRDGVSLTFNQIQMSAPRAILKQLDEQDYDLVVMGSHGRRGLRRLILGSVAEQTVRHAPVSTVVVHRKTE